MCFWPCQRGLTTPIWLVSCELASWRVAENRLAALVSYQSHLIRNSGLKRRFEEPLDDADGHFLVIHDEAPLKQRHDRVGAKCGVRFPRHT